MELRVNKDIEAKDTGISLIPLYEDLRVLFRDFLDKGYSREEYVKQFTLRVTENISKTERILKVYSELGPDVPDILFSILEEHKKRLEDLKREKGDYISPLSF